VRDWTALADEEGQSYVKGKLQGSRENLTTGGETVTTTDTG